MADIVGIPKLAWYCYSCREEVDKFQRVYGDGVCPHCGHSSGGKIIEAYCITYYLVRKTWWKIWQKKEKVFV